MLALHEIGVFQVEGDSNLSGSQLHSTAWGTAGDIVEVNGHLKSMGEESKKVLVWNGHR